MSFYSYEGIPDKVLDEKHTTSTGESYTLRQNEKLKVEMAYFGKGNSGANSQGWERDQSKYFKTLQQNHPEMFSKKNALRVKEGKTPIIDQKMIASNPEWTQYRNQPLVHHHIGGDGEAVAVPKNAHKGQGEIHNHEKAAGITDNCRNFSKKCSSDPNSIGKTASQLHTQMNSKTNSSSRTNSSQSARLAASQRSSKSNSGSVSRSDAVRSAAASKSATSQSLRAQSVRDSAKPSGVSYSVSRSNSVRSTVKGSGTSGTGRSSTRSIGTGTHSVTPGSKGASHGVGSSVSSRGGSSGGSGQSK